MAIRRKHIRTVAEDLLTNHKIKSAPVPIYRIAQSLGVSIHSTHAQDNLSGFIYRNRNDNSAIIGLNERHSERRNNFTAAHEIGHFLLHDVDEIHVDHIRLRDENSSKGTNSEEVEANLFAAELLMPERFLETDIQRIGVLNLMEEETISDLADRYQVSSHAMTIRLASLGYLKI